MSYQAVRAMPMRAFLFMGGQIERVLAERDLRALSISQATAGIAAGHSGNVEVVREKLTRELKLEITDGLNDELDRVGLNGLRAMQ